MKIKKTLEHLQSRKFLRDCLSKLASKAKTVVLGSNNELTHIKDRMTSDSSKLSVVTIHGMDGSDSIKQLDDGMREAREEQLSEHLCKSLKGRKYLIVMDNVRDTKVWDLVWRLPPKDDEGSRVLLTTSKPNVVD
ncbi:late blight resistance homolog R1A-10 [Olea europaea subsp. europaea]|uniref:Late blight resistance homolog R1A-10 n=1 Tax=Olea europaea subsp. europaea TaxID=158383 RepID=A0A8S0Q4Q9_OLEEU|nr:late blight resistance homolog R1A-10 [Olea europaea subsp. europaea]